MKLQKVLILATFFAFSLNSFAQKKVAVVTFYADKMIGFEDLEIPAGELLKNILDLRNNPDFNLTPMLNEYHSKFMNEYSKKFPFELLPETVVTENQEYIDFTPKFDVGGYDALNYVMYPGYKYIWEGMFGKSNEETMAKMFADKADGVLFVNISFDLQKGFGVGSTATVKMGVNTRIALYNKKGEKVFAFTEGENSKKTSVMVKGIPVMSPKKILPMCESALEQLMGDLDKKLAKIVKKSDDKL